MFKKIMNKTILGIAASIFMMAQGAYAFEVKGESFPANFNITSWTAGNGEAQSPLKELLEKVMEKFT